MTEPELRPYEPSRRETLFDLYERVWGERPDPAEDEWWHERNPAGPSRRTLAERDGRVVSAATLSFLRARIGGQEENAPVAVGLATDAAERGRGLLSALEGANEDAVAAGGSTLALIFPNDASRALYRKLGWQEVWRARVWARPALPRIARGRFRIEEVTEIPPGIDRLPRGDAALNGPVVDARFLDWRYLHSPRPYRVLVARYGEDVRGLVAVRLRRGRVAVVGHALGDVAQLLRALGANGALATVAVVPPRLRRSFLAAGFLPTLKTVDVLGKALSPERSLAGRWEFQLGDFDVF